MKTIKPKAKGRYDKKGNPRFTRLGALLESDLTPRQVPCGHCAFCLEQKRNDWAFRIKQEMRLQELPGYFLTFTYNERFVQKTAWGLSLRFKDVQWLFKRIRKEGFKLKYVCVGEYGGETERPHYHVLMWTDCPVERVCDLWYIEWKGQKWPLGTVHIGTLEMASAMYALKYIIQPRKTYKGREKPRAQFSHGIGLGYLTADVYEWHTDEHNPRFYSYVDGHKVALPRYYRKKIFTTKQCQQNAQKTKWDSIRDKRNKMRVLLSQGVSNASAFIQRGREEEAKAIFRKSKVNTSL